MAMQESLYERDFYAWALRSARLVREGRFAELEAERLAEELESMGKSERRALESRLTVLLAYLLKWAYQPQRRSKSWERTLTEQRKQVTRLLADSPSLAPRLPELVADAYDSARRWAADETGMEEGDFPEGCPWQVDQVLDRGYLP